MSESAKVCVIDNGGQWTHRVWRVLRELECDSTIIPNTTPIDEIDADGLILSGGAPRVAWESPKLGHCADYFDRFQGPILGICVGMQLMALHYGGKAGPAVLPEYGLADMTVTESDDLFRGLPKKFFVWESHNDEVKQAPGFVVLAFSENCKIQAIKHKGRPLYGVQFHPEVNNTQNGQQILANFVDMVRSRRGN